MDEAVNTRQAHHYCVNGGSSAATLALLQCMARNNTSDAKTGRVKTGRVTRVMKMI